MQFSSRPSVLVILSSTCVTLLYCWELQTIYMVMIVIKLVGLEGYE
jgi:hypothetical protein